MATSPTLEEMEAACVSVDAATQKEIDTQLIIDNSTTAGGTAAEKTAHTKAVNALTAALGILHDLSVAFTDATGITYVCGQVDNMRALFAKTIIGRKEFSTLHTYMTDGKNKTKVEISGQQRITLLNLLNEIAKADVDGVINIFGNLKDAKTDTPSLFSVDTAFATVPHWSNQDEANAYTTIITIVNMLSDKNYAGVTIDANTAGNIIAEINNDAGERVRYFLLNIPTIQEGPPVISNLNVM